MCSFVTRVYRRGYYARSLNKPCAEAKKEKKVCDSGSEISSTMGGWCFMSDCDKKPNGLQEGPGPYTRLRWGST